MSAQLSFAPVAVFHSGATDYVIAARDFARTLMDRVIPACVLRCSSTGGLGLVTDASVELLKIGILPVTELNPSDPTPPLRNLFESCSLGILRLVWIDGEPDFNVDDVLEILNGTGRFRLPIDIVLYFRGNVPDSREYQRITKKMSEFTGKYGHTQVVHLAEIPHRQGDTDFCADAVDRLKTMIGICPRTLPAVGPSLWVNYSDIRSIAGDLGIHPIDVMESSGDTFHSTDLKGASYIAKQIGLPVIPRLPLVPGFYRKGWYSFEVGKVLDAWVDRKLFRDYKERPGWLED